MYVFKEEMLENYYDLVLKLDFQSLMKLAEDSRKNCIDEKVKVISLLTLANIVETDDVEKLTEETGMLESTLL